MRHWLVFSTKFMIENMTEANKKCLHLQISREERKFRKKSFRFSNTRSVLHRLGLRDVFSSILIMTFAFYTSCRHISEERILKNFSVSLRIVFEKKNLTFLIELVLNLRKICERSSIYLPFRLGETLLQFFQLSWDRVFYCFVSSNDFKTIKCSSSWIRLDGLIWIDKYLIHVMYNFSFPRKRYFFIFWIQNNNCMCDFSMTPHAFLATVIICFSYPYRFSLHFFQQKYM